MNEISEPVVRAYREEDMKDKFLKAEIWEIQIILYLILAQLVETDWIMWAIRIYALFAFVMTLRMVKKAYKELATQKQ